MMEDPDRPPPQGAFPVWSRVYTQPSVRTFIEITEHPEAKANGAYVWVFIAGTLATLITSLLQSVIIRQVSPEVGQSMSRLLPGGAIGVFGASLGILSMVCVSGLSGLFSTLGFAISTALVQAASSALGGRGTFDKLAYAFGAIAVPATLISALIAPLSAIPAATYCTIPLLLALAFYVIVLQVKAIRAVHRLGWGSSILALLLPGIVLVLLCGLLFVGLVVLAGPGILQDMQQVAP
jgi:hypothetical protein